MAELQTSPFFSQRSNSMTFTLMVGEV